jgi:hypothetical protein
MKITLSIEEILEGVKHNDGRAQKMGNGQHDAVLEAAEKFGIDLEELEKIAAGRALHAIGGKPTGMISHEAFAKWIGDLASHGAMWMDGFFAALTAIAAKDEDCS